MRFRVELSHEAQKQLSRFPRDVRERMERAIDEFEEKDDSQWKGRLRKTAVPIGSFL
jgi:mRNA-degrading endonuclease RelE of RelBE toxin-antitoxin system